MSKNKDHKYYVLNKPYLMLSQFSSTDGHASLSELSFPDKSVYPVGRLDYDSEGLLILTNDKYLIHQLTAHDNKHTRTYIVQVEGMISTEALDNLALGIEISINGKIFRTKPCNVRIKDIPDFVSERVPPIRFRKDIPTSWIEISLSEGKNRQVRRMTAKVGFPTLRLIRISIESLQLGTLLPGQFVQISRNNIYTKLNIL